MLMAISPDDFDTPVKDYDFSLITDSKSLIRQMGSAGGFTATKLAAARDILVNMKQQINAASGDSFPLLGIRGREVPGEWW